MEEAHARLCAKAQWVLNEKRIVEHAGLGNVQRMFAAVPEAKMALLDWTARLGELLERETDSLGPRARSPAAER